jgi:hypothetical protein
MSECNCCCCAYHSPPWWVTMGYGGYVPPSQTQPQQSSGAPPPPRSVVVPPPPRSVQTVPASTDPAQATPRGPRPTPTQLAGDLARGDIVSTFTDLVALL